MRTSGQVSSGQGFGWPERRWVLALSALVPVLITAAWAIGDALQPTTYSPVRQTVSVLAGHAARDRWLVTAAVYLVGAGYLATAAGLRVVGLPARAGLVVAGLSAIGIAACPEPTHGSTPQHMVFTGIGGAAITVWPLLVHWRPAPVLVVRRRVSLAATGVFVVLLVWTVAEARVGDQLGIAERISASVELSWPFVIALVSGSALVRARQRAPRRCRTPA